MPSASSLPSSRRWRSVLSANASSASVTRLCWSASARTSVALGRARRPRRAASRSATGRRPRTVSVSPSATCVEQVRARRVDEADARAHELERAGVRKAAGARGRDVDDGPHAGVDELLGRDAVEIDVVDDREVAGPQPLDEILRPPAEPGGAGDLGHARARTRSPSGTPRRRACARARRGARRPTSSSIPCGSGRRAPSRRGSAASATFAICGRWVIVIDLRALREPAQRLGHAMRGDAADPGVDLVEDERLATGDDGERKRDARELAARRRVGDRPERHAGIRPDQEGGLVPAARPRLALLAARPGTRPRPCPRPRGSRRPRLRTARPRPPSPRAALRSAASKSSSARASSAAATASGSRPPSSASSSAAALSRRSSSSSSVWAAKRRRSSAIRSSRASTSS